MGGGGVVYNRGEGGRERGEAAGREGQGRWDRERGDCEAMGEGHGNMGRSVMADSGTFK